MTDAAALDGESPLVVAHLSDLHLDGGRSVERASAVVSYLASAGASLDAVVITGDLADHGQTGEYQQARELLDALHVPVAVCPGNHDRRDPFRRVLLDDDRGDEPVNTTLDLGRAVVALCDSTVPGRDDGYLADTTLDWLEQVLSAAGERPVLVGCHHPPATLQLPFLDTYGQHGESRLATLLRRHANVAALLCGHAHTATAATFADVPLRVAPGVASSLQLPWETGDLLDYTTNPGLAIHFLDGALTTTHYRWLAL